MRLVARSLFALLLAVGALACSDSSLTDSQSVAAQVVGTWSEPFDLPGESLVMTLATSDTVVTGTGTYTFEAGHSGTTTVAGVVSDTTINFDVTFDFGQVMHFRGGLTGRTKLLGIWYATPVGDPVNIEFDKVQ